MKVSLLPSGIASSAGTVGATRPAPPAAPLGPLGPAAPPAGSLGPGAADFAQPAMTRTSAIVRARIATSCGVHYTSVASWRPCRGPLSRAAGQRQVADPGAGQARDGVGDRGGDRRHTDLADAAGALLAGDDLDVQRARQLVEARDALVVEVALLGRTAAERDPAVQRERQPEGERAFH